MAVEGVTAALVDGGNLAPNDHVRLSRGAFEFNFDETVFLAILNKALNV